MALGDLIGVSSMRPMTADELIERLRKHTRPIADADVERARSDADMIEKPMTAKEKREQRAEMEHEQPETRYVSVPRSTKRRR